MKNNRGFGKFEVLTVIVLLMAIGAYLMFCVLKGSSKEGFQTMKNSAIKFGNAASVNNDTFHNTGVVYLGEVQDEKLISNIKNPLGKGYCSPSESFAEIGGSSTNVTFRCGNYLIDKADFASISDVQFYEVTDWVDTKSEATNDEKTLYNCIVDGKEKYAEYYEEPYFVYLINKDYDGGHYFANTITDCEVVSKTFYREKKLYEEKKEG